VRERLKRCEKINKNRFAFSFFGLVDIKKDGAHQNALFFDIKNKTVYHFDPNTETNDLDDKEAIKAIRQWVTEKLGWDYVPPIDLCPIWAVQYFQNKEVENNPLLVTAKRDPKGFCAYWSIYFLEQVLSNPRMDFNQVVKKFIDNEIEMTKFIRNYGNFILSTIRKLKLPPDVVDGINFWKDNGIVSWVVYKWFDDELKKELDKQLFIEQSD
jgi:hypothetical protein